MGLEWNKLSSYSTWLFLWESISLTWSIKSRLSKNLRQGVCMHSNLAFWTPTKIFPSIWTRYWKDAEDGVMHCSASWEGTTLLTMSILFWIVSLVRESSIESSSQMQPGTERHCNLPLYYTINQPNIDFCNSTLCKSNSRRVQQGIILMDPILKCEKIHSTQIDTTYFISLKWNLDECQLIDVKIPNKKFSWTTI